MSPEVAFDPQELLAQVRAECRAGAIAELGPTAVERFDAVWAAKFSARAFEMLLVEFVTAAHVMEMVESAGPH